MVSYTVKSGDTLSKIAKQFYNDASKYDIIAKANNITNPNSIHVGQVLQIPDVPPPLVEQDSILFYLNINTTKFRLPTTEYFTEPQPKQMVMLHFTAGLTAESAFLTFKGSPSKVATPYVVDRDGTIYELFPPECWAIHLFRHKKGEYPFYYQLEKCTIPIEIANVGPLKPDAHNPDQLNWWPPPDPVTGRETYSKKWCVKTETEKYVTASDRGIDYYATFTDAQYTAVKDLVAYLCTRFNIPKQAPAEKLKTDVQGLANYHGVACHQNFRIDKFDIGPAFDWTRIGL
jgi:N-acetyl-anhydromuramyl-L-alanine amidase AmpD